MYMYTDVHIYIYIYTKQLIKQYKRKQDIKQHEPGRLEIRLIN